MLGQQKVETIAKKQWTDKGENSLSIEDNRYYDSDIINTDSDKKDGFDLPEDWNNYQI